MVPVVSSRNLNSSRSCFFFNGSCSTTLFCSWFLLYSFSSSLPSSYFDFLVAAADFFLYALASYSWFFAHRSFIFLLPMKSFSCKVTIAFSAASREKKQTNPQFCLCSNLWRSILPKGCICSAIISSVISSVIPPRNKVVIDLSSGASGGLLFSSILSMIFLAMGSFMPLNLSLILSSMEPLPFLRPSKSYSVMLVWR